MSKIEDTAQDLLNEFSDNSETSKKVTQIETSDPYLELKMDLLDFFRDRMRKISGQEAFKLKVEEALEAEVERGELSFEQLLSLYRLVASQNNTSSDSLLSLFKPTPGAPSILADNLGKHEEKKDVYDEMYDQFSSEQLQSIDKLAKLMQSVMKNSGEEKV